MIKSFARLQWTLGVKASYARKIKGMKQKDAATKLKISAAYLSLIENGKRTPTVKLIYKMSRLYGEEPHWFIQEEVLLNEMAKSR